MDHLSELAIQLRAARERCSKNYLEYRLSFAAESVVGAEIVSYLLRQLGVKMGDKFTYTDENGVENNVFFEGFSVNHLGTRLCVRRVLRSGKPGKYRWLPGYENIVEIAKEGVRIRLPK